MELETLKVPFTATVSPLNCIAHEVAVKWDEMAYKLPELVKVDALDMTHVLAVMRVVTIDTVEAATSRPPVKSNAAPAAALKTVPDAMRVLWLLFHLLFLPRLTVEVAMRTLLAISISTLSLTIIAVRMSIATLKTALAAKERAEPARARKVPAPENVAATASAIEDPLWSSMLESCSRGRDRGGSAIEGWKQGSVSTRGTGTPPLRPCVSYANVPH